jgi:hypothetical protein
MPSHIDLFYGFEPTFNHTNIFVFVNFQIITLLFLLFSHFKTI